MNKAKKAVTLLVMVLLFVAVHPPSIHAQSSLARYQALYTMRFLKYINWQTSQNEYVIGVVGSTSKVLLELTKLTKGRLVNGKKVIVTKITSYANLNRYSVIFLPKTQNSKFYRILRLIKGEDVLLVTEDPNMVRRGAGISFYVVNSKLKFRLNKQTIYARKMTVNSRLLSVATVI